MPLGQPGQTLFAVEITQDGLVSVDSQDGNTPCYRQHHSKGDVVIDLSEKVAKAIIEAGFGKLHGDEKPSTENVSAVVADQVAERTTEQTPPAVEGEPTVASQSPKQTKPTTKLKK